MLSTSYLSSSGKRRFASKTLAVAIAAIWFAGANIASAEVGNPRVNQLGYLPAGIKVATYKTTLSAEQDWQLKQNGTVVASGKTKPFGFDAASGDSVQQIDLSAVTVTGKGFTLTVGADTSYAFEISTTVFKSALYDSLRYFYHNRSGIEIKQQYTGGGNGSYAVDAKWARPAGHLNQGLNKGDVNTPCWSGTCNYSLNVSKGWYDAGDHGKYVVNGGISVWTLLNLYERDLYFSMNGTRLGDGTFNIPESTNGIADILDEARWEMEFLLSMQVPSGQAKAGMVHHKMHDVGWTGFPLAPHEDAMQRALVPPSTAATLNLAATAAQAARIWKDIDSGFSSSCLTAAKVAWNAAIANPKDLYSGLYDNGGGGYGDETLSDDFYWAAAELYITTGDSKYLNTINSYSVTQTDLSWADTALAGVISLAVVPASHTSSLRSSAQQKVISRANAYIATQNASGYPAPMASMDYQWGSSGTVANKLLFMGLAYDFTKIDSYAQGLGKGLGYLLGQNTLSTSLVTGEGTKTVIQPHHRFWSHAENAAYPFAPPGALSGGPNSGLEDTTSKAQLAACTTKPASCWIDNIKAYAVNEITINWNAPLAWNLAFYNDYALGNSGSAASSASSSSVISSSSVWASSSVAPSSLSSSSVSSSSSIKSSSVSSLRSSSVSSSRTSSSTSSNLSSSTNMSSSKVSSSLNSSSSVMNSMSSSSVSSSLVGGEVSSSVSSSLVASSASSVSSSLASSSLLSISSSSKAVSSTSISSSSKAVSSTLSSSVAASLVASSLPKSSSSQMMSSPVASSVSTSKSSTSTSSFSSSELVIAPPLSSSSLAVSSSSQISVASSAAESSVSSSSPASLQEPKKSGGGSMGWFNLLALIGLALVSNRKKALRK